MWHVPLTDRGITSFFLSGMGQHSPGKIVRWVAIGKGSAKWVKVGQGTKTSCKGTGERRHPRRSSLKALLGPFFRNPSYSHGSGEGGEEKEKQQAIWFLGKFHRRAATHLSIPKEKKKGVRSQLKKWSCSSGTEDGDWSYREFKKTFLKSQERAEEKWPPFWKVFHSRPTKSSIFPARESMLQVRKRGEKGWFLHEI